MKQSAFLLILLALGGEEPFGRFANAAGPVRSSNERVCADGISRFGKVSCGEPSESEPLLQAYFYGSTTLEEISKAYPERLAKLRSICHRKAVARGLAGHPSVAGRVAAVDRLRFRVESIDSCNGKREYQEPCVRNEDCVENVCHPVRGTCSTVSNVPIPFGP